MGGSYLINVGPNAEGEITEEYACRIRRIGDWYNRMEGALTCHEADDFRYKLRANQAIVTKKNGKSYFHFPDGVRSSSIALAYFPCVPHSVRLLNTDKSLNAAIDLLPEYQVNGQALPFLHITGIPVDDLSDEAIVIEIEW